MGGEIISEYHLTLPIESNIIKKLRIKDVLYISGNLFTARDEAHKLMLKIDKIPFEISSMALYHCGPLMKKNGDNWKVISAGPTTSSRMELYEEDFIKKSGINLIIGKGGMFSDIQKSLQKYICVYASYTGGVGALAAEKIEKVIDVFWLEKLGMPEATWILKVKEFGPLIVSMDSEGNSLYNNHNKNE